MGGYKGVGFKWSGSIVRFRLWLCLPHSCYRPLSRSQRSAFLEVTLFSDVRGSTGLGVHTGQRSLPSRVDFAGPIRPLLVGLAWDLRFKNPVGTGFG